MTLTTCAGVPAGDIPAGLEGVRKLAFLIKNIFAMTSKKIGTRLNFWHQGRGFWLHILSLLHILTRGFCCSDFWMIGKPWR